MIERCNAICLITHKTYIEKIETDRKCINLDEFNFDDVNYENVKSDISNEDLIYLIYTSGSTGVPKAVMLSHKNVVGLIESMKADKMICPTEEDVSLSLLKFSFDASGIDLYSSLLFGGTLVLMEKQEELNITRILEVIEKEKVTRSFLTPKWVEQIVIAEQNEEIDVSSLKVLGTGGEILKPEIIKDFLNKYPNTKVLNLYGPSETTMFVTIKRVEKENVSDNYVTIGKPIKYARVIILDKKDKILPTGVKGELAIYEDSKSIQNIAKGYLGLEQITKDKFKKIYNPIIKQEIEIYKTGDIVKINKDLELEFIGREDDIVKVNRRLSCSIKRVREKN